MDDEFPFLPPDYAVMTPSSDDLRRDPRVAALTAAIHSLHHHITIANGQPSPDFDGELAAAILAAVPDWTLVPADELEGKRDEIATLRAALADEKERNGLYLATLDNMNATIARLRAALTEIRDTRSRYSQRCQWCDPLSTAQLILRPHAPDCPAALAEAALAP